MSDLTQWTLDRLTTKIQRDLQLHAEVFVEKDDIKSFINDAIDDAEELIIDAFSDFFITYKDYEVTSGQAELDFPTDIYEMRTRGMYFDKHSYQQSSAVFSGVWYKVKRISLETVATVTSQDLYQYRNVNSQTDGPKILIYPNIRDDSTGRFRLWYIRKAKRLDADSDILETGLRPQFVLSHAKIAILQKEGSDLLPLEIQKFGEQKQKLLDSLSRVSDDDEDSYLKPDINALYEAYGDGTDIFNY